MTKNPKTKQRTRKTKNSRVQQLEQQLAQVKIKAKTPFSTAGALVGARAGQMFNMPMLKGVGKWLGSGIGSIFGSGDYTMAGANPEYNVLANGNQIPKFSTTHATNIVCHREYLGDIVGTAAFNNTAYPINPGLATTFPWLSTIADNYQEYKFHGIIFEFRPLITDFVTGGAPGVVIMATNYNADLPVYTSKQIMENSEFAVSVKPTLALMHGVECSPAQTDPIIKYVRSTVLAAGQDLKNYDWGNFQFATQSNPIQNLGELWVSYCVEFYKPVLTTTAGPVASGITGHINKTAITTASPFGSVQRTNSGSLGISTTSTTITIPATANQLFLVDLVWFGTATAVVTTPSISFTNAVAQSYYTNGADTFVTTPSPVATANSVNYQVVVKTTATGNIVVTSGTATTFPGGTTSLDIYVCALDATTTA
jgi:hypothetical protein